AAVIKLGVGDGRTFGKLNLAGRRRDDNEIGKVDVASSGVSGKLDNAWSASVLPGFRFGSDVLVFARIGYARAELKGSFLGTDPSKSHNGWLWGLGCNRAVKHPLASALRHLAYHP